MLRAMVLFAVALLAAQPGVAQEPSASFPSRPITVIVPFPAGGITDIVARIVGERMATSLDRPLIVENIGGAGGTIGVGRLFRSTPDGHTLVVGQWTSHVGAGAMFPLPFDLLADFEPISVLSTGAFWIIGRKDLPARDLAELIAWLKANPGKATGGTGGAGSGFHMCMLYFQNMTGTQFSFVPYRGAAPIMQDLVAGQIDLTCPEAGQTLAHYRAGSIKAYGVLTRQRWFAAPEVPTIEEAGVPGLEFPFWHGLWAPKGTPGDVIAKINAAVVVALADPAVRRRLEELGHEVAPRAQQSPAGLHAVHKADIEKWWPIIKAAGIKVE